MKKKISVFLLCAAMILTATIGNFGSAFALDDTGGSIPIYCEGVETDHISVGFGEVKSISTKASGGAHTSFQWQVRYDSSKDKWADIYGETKEKIKVSQALIEGIKDESGDAYLRCALTENSKVKYTKTLRAAVGFDREINEKSKKKIYAAAEPILESESVKVTVNYLSENGEKLFNSYESEPIPGEAFSEEVISPAYLGYEPYYNEEDPSAEDPEQATKPAFRITISGDGNADVTVNVYYKPIDVPYAVRYFFQNIYDDGYTEDQGKYRTGEAKTGTVITDEELALTAEESEGFTALYHYPESIAADGSTVFECYYDRNYYLIKFDMNGGYGTNPIYARYGTPIIINNPTLNGWTFDGWVDVTDNPSGDSGDDNLPLTVPAENKTYRALWKDGKTEVTYVYWKQNANDDGYSYWGQKTVTGIDPSDPISGKDDFVEDFDKDEQEQKPYFEFNDEKTDKNVKVKLDGSSIINVYYDRKTYEVRFYIAKKDANGAYYICYFTNGDKVDFSSYKTAIKAKITEEQGKALTVGIEDDLFSEKDTDGSTYYYLKLCGKYEERIFSKWPIEGAYVGAGYQENKPRPTEMDLNNTHINFLNWRAESGSKYANIKENNNTPYIQGPYVLLTGDLINDTENEIASSWIMRWTDKLTDKDIMHAKYEFPNLNNELEEITYIYPLEGGNGQQTACDFEGFVTPSNSQGNPITFTYSRKTPKLYVNNICDEKIEMILDTSRVYGAPLNMNLDMTKNYPSDVEPGAYEFDGFYSTKELIPGTEVDDDTPMPASDFVVYAKWSPIKHEVKVYEDFDSMQAGEEVTEQIDVPHRDVIGTLDPPNPPQEGLEFKGWFFIRDGIKQAFVPEDIPVTSDMEIFAEWKSNIVVPYKIQYVLLSDPSTKVADDTIGYGYQGTTRTFMPKAGQPYNQLYPAFNGDDSKGYFPTVASHSLTLKAEADPHNAVINTYTFYYVEAEEVEYTVRYIDKTTGQPLTDEKTESTTKAAVSEPYLPIDGYVPDAFYKHLVLKVNPDGTSSDENVITFYYMQGDDPQFYAVHYMLQDPNNTNNYIEQGLPENGIVHGNESVEITPKAFPNYQIAKAVKVPNETELSLVNGSYTLTVDQDLTELYIYYNYISQEYDYTVQYLEYATNEKLAEPLSGKGVLGQMVTESAIDIDGYTLISSSPKSIIISSNIDSNIITFYYSASVNDRYTVEYEPWPSGGGTCTPQIETILKGEELKGSKPSASDGFIFDGWYLDADCTTPVTSDIATVDDDGTIHPIEAKLDVSPGKNVFYAKFISTEDPGTDEPKSGLTIIRKNTEDEREGSQVFVYTVTSVENPELKITVTVTGNDQTTIQDLPTGKYTVTQENDWSWRYGDEPIEVEIKEGAGTEVTFDDSATNSSWLSGCSNLIKNIWGALT